MVVQVCSGTIRCACTAPRCLIWASRRASCGRFQCKLRPDGTFCCHERSKLQVGTYGQPQSHLGLYLRYPASCGCHHSPALCLYIARYAAGRRSHKMIDLARTVTRGAVDVQFRPQHVQWVLYDSGGHFLAAHVRFAGRTPSVDGHICAPASRVSTLRTCFVEL